MDRCRWLRKWRALIPGRWSLRSQLVVWNSAALLLLLAVLGLIAHYAVRSFLLLTVDHELEMRVDRFVHHGGPVGPPPADGPHGRPQQTSASDVWSWLFGQTDGAGAQAPAQTERPHRPTSSTFRRSDEVFYAPRIVDAGGRVVGPEGVTTVPDPEAVKAAFRGRTVFTVVEVGGERLRVLTRPMTLRPPIDGVVQAPYPLREVDLAMEGWSRVSLLLVPLAILCAGFSGYMMTGRVLRPVKTMTKAAATMGAADLSDRLPVVGRDEFAELATTFNGMLGRLDDAFRQQAAMVDELRRMVEQQRRFTADASHELRTPLTVIKANASLCLQDANVTGEVRQSLEDVNAAADRMSRLVQDLLLLARSDGGQLGRNRCLVPLADILERATAMTFSTADVVIQYTPPPADLCINVDDGEIVRVFCNILNNAIRWTPVGGRVSVRAVASPTTVSVSVADTGVGIDPKHLPHLCERFYRVDTARSRTDGGSGLGLSICKEILDIYGGSMRFESEVGVGTTVTITLPLSVANVCASM